MDRSVITWKSKLNYFIIGSVGLTSITLFMFFIGIDIIEERQQIQIQNEIKDLEWNIEYLRLHKELVGMYGIKLQGVYESDWNDETKCFEKSFVTYKVSMCGYNYGLYLDKVEKYELRIKELKNE